MIKVLRKKQDIIFQQIKKNLVNLTPAYKLKLVSLILTPDLERKIIKQEDSKIDHGLKLLRRLWNRNKNKNSVEAEEIIQQSIQAIRIQNNA